jgi:hypothetical protein
MTARMSCSNVRDASTAAVVEETDLRISELGGVAEQARARLAGPPRYDSSAPSRGWSR